jgi:predicted phosphodiesterase
VTDLLAKLDVLEQDSNVTEDLRMRSQAPAGWNPGVVWENGKGQIITPGLTEAPDEEQWGALLEARGMDSKKYEIVNDNVSWCSWDGWRRDAPGAAAYSATQYSYKAQIRLKGLATNDIEALYKEIRARKKPGKMTAGPVTLIVALADFQIGNGDQTMAAQLTALANIGPLVVQRTKQLRKMGVEIGRVVIAGLGDLVESCDNFYPGQTFTVLADRRTQIRIARRTIRDIIKDISPHVAEVLVTAVGGNHGENRRNGKAYTGPADNDDVAVVEQVADMFSFNPDAFSHVGFRLPDDRLAINFNVSHTMVGFTHGHLCRGKDATAAVWNWWRDQTMGKWYPGIAQSDILVAGHFHHHCVKVQDGRALLIAPSLLRFSDYWGDVTGDQTQPGTMTFTVENGRYNNLEVLV